LPENSVGVHYDVERGPGQADLAVALRQQIKLSEQMLERLDEYESQHVLMRRLLRVAQRKRE